MRDAMRGKKGSESQEFSPIIRVKVLDFGLKTVFNKGFELGKDHFDL